MTPPCPRARSPVDHRQVAHSAKVREADGWQLPLVFSSAEQEAVAVRNAVGLADLSALAKWSVRGLGVGHAATALDFSSHLQQPRQIVWLQGDKQPWLACRLSDDHLLLLAPRTAGTALLEGLASLLDTAQVVQRDATSTYAGFCLAGPRLETVLQRLTSLDVSATALPPGTCAETNVAGVHGLLIRPPKLAVHAVYLYVAWDVGQYVWDTLMATGRAVGLEPIGLETWQTLACYSPEV